MTFHSIARLVGAALLAAGLAGCMDATLDFEVQSETTGKATSTIVFEKEMLSMLESMGAAGAEGAPSTDDFCPETGTRTETDTAVTCVETKEGTFAELELGGEDGDGPTITSAGPGLVRVAFPTKDLAKQVDPSAGEEDAEEMDEQTKAMMGGIFGEHFIKIIVRGAEITDTNMELSGDKKSAERTIPWMELLESTGAFPEELYAVVKVN